MTRPILSTSSSQNTEKHSANMVSGAAWQRFFSKFTAITSAISLVLALINIISKEHTLKNGEKVLIELAPVDPRTLM